MKEFSTTARVHFRLSHPKSFAQISPKADQGDFFSGKLGYCSTRFALEWKRSRGFLAKHAKIIKH